jgi:hypothetical protein
MQKILQKTYTFTPRFLILFTKGSQLCYNNYNENRKDKEYKIT